MAEDRAVPERWEGGLLRGSMSSQIVTLVERRGHYVMLVENAQRLPQALWD